MQKVKSNLFLQLVVVPAFLISDFILARYYPELILKIYPFHWISLFLLLFFCFFPKARRALINSTQEKPRCKLYQWVALIGLFELSAVAAWTGLIELLNLIQPELNLNLNLFNETWVKEWGLFPWGLLIGMGSLMAYYAYFKNKDASLATLMFPLFRSPPSGTLGITANVCARLNLVLVMSGSFMVASLSLAWLGTHFLGLSFLAGANLENILSLSLVFILITHRKFGARLFETLLVRHVSVPLVIMVAIIFMASLFILSNWLLHSVAIHAVILPAWLMENAPTTEILRVLIAVWSLAWCVVGGIFLAYISRGYTLLQLILVSLFLPVLGIFLGQYVEFFSPSFILIVAACGISAIIYLFTHNSTLLMLLMQVYVAAQDQVKHRNYHHTVINWLRISMALSYMYLIGGALLLALLVISYVLPTFIYFLTAVIASTIWFARNK